MPTLVQEIHPLGFVWPTADPFLFCVHHDDSYPKGDDRMAPAASLAGRNIGQDFEPRDGWRMYHGDVVPGFPSHPHRGFETVTIVRRGYIDHSDSLGATARFGAGDVQWLTAGGGIVHSEMFPLRERERANPLELFQIWLNLPRRSKMVPAHFSMLWAEDVPVVTTADAQGRKTELTIIAGTLADTTALPPPPDSWASDPRADVAIWSIRMEPGAEHTLPAAVEGSTRTVYFFGGTALDVGGTRVPARHGARVQADVPATLKNGDTAADILVLQGRAIGEPVVQHGPFVMNTKAEIQQAFNDYQRTQFGGWPWTSRGPVHARERGRFARHADGAVEERG